MTNSRNDGILDEILNEIASSFALLPRNDGILDGILNEIASSFVSLTPRNDGISVMTEF